jgi:signal transduction histidine kinase
VTRVVARPLSGSHASGIEELRARRSTVTDSSARRRAFQARTAVWLGVPGLAAFIAVLLIARLTVGYPYDLSLRVLSAMVVVNVVAALTAERWATSLLSVYLFEGLYVVVVTAMLYGERRSSWELDRAMLLNSYFTLAIHTQTFRSDASALVTATICTLCYCALVPIDALAFQRLPSWQREACFVIAGSLTLYLIAFYANRYGQQLGYFAQHLQRLVGERTRDLAAANKELAVKADALEQRQEELRNFVYAVTHDVANPLNSIHLIADLIRTREGDSISEEGRQDLDRIVNIASASEEMVRDLLDLFRITSAPEQPAWVDLNALLVRACEAFAPQIDAKRAEVRVAALPRVWGQPEKLGHVTTNLLGNAVKYVRDGRGHIEITADVRDGGVVLCVADDGIGIPPEYHRRIFELFGRVPVQEQRVNGHTVAGSGVGLAIVQRIVEAHGGVVWVESAPGKGSRFYVRLPGVALAS